jgi:hypothetical protein
VKSLITVLLIITTATVSAAVFATSSGGTHSVKGHTTKNGTYIAPHQQTNPNGTQRDNWSSKPNVNPYTGKAGTVEPQK